MFNVSECARRVPCQNRVRNRNRNRIERESKNKKLRRKKKHSTHIKQTKLALKDSKETDRWIIFFLKLTKKKKKQMFNMDIFDLCQKKKMLSGWLAGTHTHMLFLICACSDFAFGHFNHCSLYLNDDNKRSWTQMCARPNDENGM